MSFGLTNAPSSGFSGFGVSGSAFWVRDFVVRGFGFVFPVSGFRVQIRGFTIWGFAFGVFGVSLFGVFEVRGFGFRFLVSGLGFAFGVKGFRVRGFHVCGL